MNNMILRFGQAAGVVGVLLMAVAVLIRLSSRSLGGFESITLLMGGIAATCAGCFALLCVIASRGRN